MRTEHRHTPGRLARALAVPLALAAALAAAGPAGASPAGPIPIVTVGLGVPAAPQPAAAPSFASVRLSWTPGEAGSGPILRYSVYRGLSPLTLFPYATVEAAPGGGPVEYVDRSADLGVTYHYAVTATNAVGEGARSEIVSASPMPVGTVFATARWTGRDDAYDIAMLAGGVVTKLSRDDGDHQTPAVSPDGSTIAYASNHGNDARDYDLWVQRPGAEPVRVTSGPDADAEPAFSPDGRTIAFTRLFHGHPSVWVVPTDGGEARRVPSTSGHANPAWAPSGRMLAVAHAVGVETALVVTNLDGTVRYRVPGTVSRTSPAYDPSFSPDGSTLSFVLLKPDGGVVASVPVEGGPVTELTKAGLMVAAQQWAPAGDRIVFEGYSENTAATMWSVVPGSDSVEPLPGGAAEPGLSPTPAEAPAPYVPASAPAPPAHLTGVLGAGTVTLRWAPPAGAAPGTWYAVRRSAPDGPPPLTAEAGEAVSTGSATTARAEGLEPGRRYQFAVFAMSLRGDAGGAAVRPARPAAAPPVLALVGDGPEFLATWESAPGLASGQTYEAQVGVRRLDRATRRWSAPAWRALSRGAAAAAVVPAVPGQTYHLRARVRDADGNATPWGTPGVVAVPYDDRAMTGTGRWADVAGKKGRFLGTLRTSSSTGAELTLRAWGSTFALLADRCRACGLLEVYVDGEKVATVDTRAPARATRQTVWSTSFDRIGRHLVTVRVVGSGGVKVDGLVARR